MEVRIIEYKSSEYEASLKLRDQVLRKPLGMDLFIEDLSRDAHETHIGVFEEGEIIGILIVAPITQRRVKIRQVGVDPDHQGLGVGKMMVTFAESYCKKRQIKEIELHSRENAIKFYEHMGFEVVSEGFIEVGVEHFAMEKYL